MNAQQKIEAQEQTGKQIEDTLTAMGRKHGGLFFHSELGYCIVAPTTGGWYSEWYDNAEDALLIINKTKE